MYIVLVLVLWCPAYSLSIVYGLECICMLIYSGDLNDNHELSALIVGYQQENFVDLLNFDCTLDPCVVLQHMWFLIALLHFRALPASQTLRRNKSCQNIANMAVQPPLMCIKPFQMV